MSRLAARFRPQADRDVDDIAAYVAAGGFEIGMRFYDAVQADSDRLAAFPGLGPVYGFSIVTLQGIRFWPISGFRKYRIFYRPLPNGGVEIIRVLHGARDVARVIRGE